MAVGLIISAVGVVVLVFGFLQWSKMKTILAAPFQKTGEIAANPAEGNISCEGAVQVAEPLVAPCSGKPCLYYEIKVERMWEKTENTEDGVKTSKGSSTVSTSEVGSRFYVNDGSGPIGVDAREKVDTELTKSFEQAQNVSYGDLVFGSYQVHVPYAGGEERTTGIRAIEKILPTEGNFFVMGKLAGGVITKQDGMLGKVIVSTKGRDALVGSTKRNAMLGFVLGGIVAVGGVPIGLLMPEGVDTCANLTDATKDGVCSARVNDDSGKTFTWKVTEKGAYEITVTATGKDAFLKLWPKLEVTKDGKQIGEDGSESGDSAKLLATFEKGTYSIKVSDVSATHVGKLKGGAGFNLDIKKSAATVEDEPKAAKEEAEPEAKEKEPEPETEKPAAEPKKPAPKPVAVTKKKK